MNIVNKLFYSGWGFLYWKKLRFRLLRTYTPCCNCGERVPVKSWKDWQYLHNCSYYWDNDKFVIWHEKCETV